MRYLHILINFNKIMVELLTIKYTKSQNIGQQYNGVPKYKTVDKDGISTGIGYSFEDKVKEDLSKTHNVESVEPYLNGPDFIVDGKLVQLKCGKDGHTSASHCYEHPDGHCRYPDQILLVPKGQKKMADVLVASKNRNGLGAPLDVAECSVTREDAEKNLWKGKDSFMKDMTSPGLIGASFKQGMGFAVAGLLAHNIISHKNLTVGKVISRTRNWALSGLGLSVVSLLAESIRRQGLRP